MFNVIYDRIQVQSVPDGKVVFYPFTIDDVEFACTLVELSCELPDITDLAYDLIENEKVITKAKDTYWIEFDTVSNMTNQTPYEQMQDTGFGFRHWVHLSNALCEIIAFHQQQYNCDFYFAEPANDRLARAYQRLLVPKLQEDGYNYYVDETDDGGWYVFYKY
ncbi:hypothetical protein L3Q72_09485 [Vibrio sp. JC009]|uniref:hypothetical protein n=1 Tax=Vibrio sp. JC009 TaxID=2912314 RepID=UPI0023B17608|nr:hypothetical protein [Vibrio sp. JC009]WED20875.1 hypothetical protein L3Q72_09485 [Vibrio sp. JC009]